MLLRHLVFDNRGVILKLQIVQCQVFTHKNSVQDFYISSKCGDFYMFCLKMGGGEEQLKT